MHHVSLDAAAATGAGTKRYLPRVPAAIGMQVSFAGGSPTVKVNLEGTINLSDWFVIGTFDTAIGGASGDIVVVNNVPVIGVRANLATLSGGTSPTVTAHISASD